MIGLIVSRSVTTSVTIRMKSNRRVTTNTGQKSPVFEWLGCVIIIIMLRIVFLCTSIWKPDTEKSGIQMNLVFRCSVFRWLLYFGIVQYPTSFLFRFWIILDSFPKDIRMSIRELSFFIFILVKPLCNGLNSHSKLRVKKLQANNSFYQIRGAWQLALLLWPLRRCSEDPRPWACSRLDEAREILLPNLSPTKSAVFHQD